MNLKRTPLYAESWNAAFRKKSNGSILEDTNTPFTVLKNNFSSWVADPFIFTHDGITYIFAEMYDYKLRRGTLGYTVLDNGNNDGWHQVIVEDYHLSYPFIFEKDNEVYIMPEASGSDSLYVYKAIDFPNKWKKVKLLFDDVKYVDTTYFTLDGKDYAFTTSVKDYDKQDEYLLVGDGFDFYETKEIPVEDFRTSRMGGNVLHIDGKHYKVCQDCTATYGGGLIFKEFSLDDLDGKSVLHILPDTLKLDRDMLVDGIHTYNGNDEYEIIDIKTRRFNIMNFFYRLMNKL